MNELSTLTVCLCYPLCHHVKQEAINYVIRTMWLQINTNRHTHPHTQYYTYTHTYIHCWTWWRIGRVDDFQPEDRGFDSRSSRHVGTLGKSFTCSCLWRFGVKLRYSIRAVVGSASE